jgi:hypothetical protein
MKDRLGEQGVEWEPIKILIRRDELDMPQNHNHGFPHDLAKVA